MLRREDKKKPRQFAQISAGILAKGFALLTLRLRKIYGSPAQYYSEQSSTEIKVIELKPMLEFVLIDC